MKLPKIYMIYFTNVPQGPEPLDGFCCLHITQNEPYTEILTENTLHQQFDVLLGKGDSRRLRAWLELAGLKNTVYVDGSVSENTFNLDYVHFPGIWAMIQQRAAVSEKKQRQQQRRAAGLGRRGPRPDQWKHGPDPVLRDMNLQHARARAQAKFRGEAWNLTFEDWCEAWAGNWHRRGRHPNSLLLSRIDVRQPWQRDNVRLVDRYEHHTNQMIQKLRKGTINQIPSRGIHDVAEVE